MNTTMTLTSKLHYRLAAMAAVGSLVAAVLWAVPTSAASPDPSAAAPTATAADTATADATATATADATATAGATDTAAATAGATAPVDATATPASKPAAAAPGAIEAVCPPATPGHATCLALRWTAPVALSAAGRVKPSAAGSGVTPSTSYSYTPADLQSAYNLPTGSQGTGLTVAIVDAFDLPTAESDLATYRSTYHLPACTTANGCFKKINQYGIQGSYPAYDAGWAGEIALDIDMVSAICPNCKILLVEANDSRYLNLGTAGNEAVSLGAVAVSNSYGGPEGLGEDTLDSAYYNHPGVAITVATGDCGYECAGQLPEPNTEHPVVEYPAASPYVVAVGGTSLVRDSSTRGWSESAWGNSHGGAGSGCSTIEPKPSWQHDASCSMRTQADVSAVADPLTGVLVYGGGSWGVYGGTSVASPIIAAVFALAGRPVAATNPASYPYANTGDLYDAVGGNADIVAGTCTVDYLCKGVAGYDGPTGLGTPNGTSAFEAPTLPRAPTAVSGIRGNASVLVSWTAPANTGGAAITGYSVTSSPGGLPCSTTGALSCTVSGLTNGTNYTFSVTATNTHGTGPASLPSAPATPATVPGAPTGVTAAPGGTSSVVSWSAAATNGATIGSYTVTSSPGGLTCGWTSGPLSCPVTGLTPWTSYTFTVTATNVIGTGPSSAASNAVTPTGAAVTATFHALNPTRLVDTRINNGIAGKLVAGVPRSLQVTGHAGVLAGATAFTADVTIVKPTVAGSLYLGSVALANPPNSTMNFNKLDVRGCGATIALSPTGAISVTYMASAGATTDVVVDVTGFFMPDPAGLTYHAMAPVRLLDSRYGNGLSGKFKASVPRQITVVGRGVPSGAKAVTGNLTVTNATGSTAAYIGPAPIAHPGSSTINFVAKQIRGNTLTVLLSSTGTLWATFIGYNSNTIDLVFDVTGYYTADLSGAQYVPLTPARVLDSRSGITLGGKFVANVPRTIPIWNQAFVPSAANGVTGVISVYNQTSGSAVFVGPDPIVIPTTSSLNFVAGDNCANGFTVALSATGSLSSVYMAKAGYTTDIVIVITGYFVGP